MNPLLGKIAITLLLIIIVISYINFQQIKTNQQQILEISQQMSITNKQSQQLDQQIEVMNVVADNLIEKRSVEKEIIAIQKQSSQEMLQMTYVAQGFSAISVFKVYIAEFYMMNGVFPKSNTDLKMSNPEEFATDVITKVEVVEGGVIKITYNEKSGINNGAISFTPQEKNQQLHWNCTTTDFVNITQFMPQCHFESE